MQPQVQSLDQILAQLDPAYAPQRAIFQQQQSLLPGQETAQLGALDVAKTNSFRDVNTQANSKGLAFSGIPSSEQTRYLGEKYLPAVAGVKSETQKQSLTLAQSLAQLESEKRLRGVDTQAGQQKTLDAYLEAERARQFQAQQAASDRAFQASQGALNRAASAAKVTGRAPTAAEVKQAVSAHIVDNFNQLKGRDNKVSNETWANALNDFTTAGGSNREFWQRYGNYVNSAYKNKYAGYSAR